MYGNSRSKVLNMPHGRWNETTFDAVEIEKIGLYSVTKDRDYVNNAENLQYLYLPKEEELPLDLNIGFGTALQKAEDENLCLHHILSYINDHEKELIERNELGVEPNRLKADLVCYRGVMRVIMSSPYDILHDWRVLVSKFNGTIYMMREGTDQEKMEKQNRSYVNKRMCAWGFKCEQHCTTGICNVAPNTALPVDECSELGCMLKANINGRTFLYSAEMDAIESPKPVGEITKEILGKLRFVEIKTRLKNFSPRQSETFYRHKTRQWWLQCYLAGIEDIYVGFRNENGIVDEIKKIPTKNLLAEAKRRRVWNETICFEYLDNFINGVDKVMDGITDPNTVVQFDYCCINRNITYKIIEGKNRKSFLPIWYRDMVNKKHSVLSIFRFIMNILRFLKSVLPLFKSTNKTKNLHNHHQS